MDSDNQCEINESQQPKETAPPKSTLKSLMKNLPPCPEMLEFYHKKINQFEREEKEYVKRLQSNRESDLKVAHLQNLLSQKDDEIQILREGLSALKSQQTSEKLKHVKMESKIDRLKINDLEQRRKVLLLLRLNGKSETEITEMLDMVDNNNNKKGEEMNLHGIISSSLEHFISSRVSKTPEQEHPLTVETFKLRCTSLENEVNEMTIAFENEIKNLKSQMKCVNIEMLELREESRVKVEDVVRGMKHKIDHERELNDEILKLKTAFRTSEHHWMAERDSLMRKNQVLQHAFHILKTKMSSSPTSSDDLKECSKLFVGGRSSNAEQRYEELIMKKNKLLSSNAECGGVGPGNVKVFKEQIEKLNVELSEKRNETDRNKIEVLRLQTELRCLKQQYEMGMERSKKQMNVLSEQICILERRVEESEKRRKAEKEGYKSDVLIMEGKVKNIKGQLLQAAIAKNKEYDYIKTINACQIKIEELQSDLKQNNEWRT